MICPNCGAFIADRPLVTVDAIIEIDGGLVLIERKHPPFGWALPGGFVDYGETLEQAVRREIREETGLELDNLQQYHTFSDPGRDPRHHTISTIFSARGRGTLQAGDDAGRAAIFSPANLPSLAFDHRNILDGYLRTRTAP